VEHITKINCGVRFADREAAESIAAACRAGDPDGWTYVAVLAARGWVVEVWDEDGFFLGDLETTDSIRETLWRPEAL
jgi:hypothetical protein